MNRLRETRKAKRMTMKAVGDAIGCTESTISNYETGKRQPDQETLVKLAELFQVSVDYLIGRNTRNQPTRTTPSIRVPVLGSIPAGIPMEAIEDIIDYEEVPADWGRGGQEYFALKIRGNSMKPVYLNGDVLIFRRQDTCDSGQDCAVMVNGDDATFKRVRRTSDGITLQPLNPDFEPRHYTNKEIEELPVRVLGVVVEIRRKIG